MRADAAQQLGETTSDVTANEVLSNINAMRYALDRVRPNSDISLDLMLEIHDRLLQSTTLAKHGGRLRKEQNWIGGSVYNPCRAEFVPPPPNLVPELMADLCSFCNDDALSAVAQAAIAHAQFETIHPFIDGNGRVGRALIHLVLRRRGLATNVSPPVSLVLATLSKDYVSGLTGTRFIGAPNPPEAIGGINRWVALVASASRRSVRDADTFEK